MGSNPIRPALFCQIDFYKLTMEIKLSPIFAKIILRSNPSNRFKVMCRGYSEDLENFTELVWEDDEYLDFADQESYPQFQLWYI